MIAVIAGAVVWLRAPMAQAAPPAYLVLSTKDVYGSVRLTPEERKGYIGVCTKGLVAVGKTLEGQSWYAVPKGAREGGTSVFEAAQDSCDCLVNGLEDRSSMLEFKLSMFLMMSKNPVVAVSMPPRGNDDFRSQAQKLGMSAIEFSRLQRNLGVNLRLYSSWCNGETAAPPEWRR